MNHPQSPISSSSTAAINPKRQGMLHALTVGVLLGSCSAGAGLAFHLTNRWPEACLPLLLLGLVLILASPAMGLFFLKGPCPYCGKELKTYSFFSSETCLVCKKKIRVTRHHFHQQS